MFLSLICLIALREFLSIQLGQVTTLKAKIQDARSDLVADRQKLIHAGKVLKDTQTVTEIGMAASDFLVCMISKETAAPKVRIHHDHVHWCFWNSSPSI